MAFERSTTHEQGQETWDKTRLGFRDNFEDEIENREVAARPAVEPNWINDRLREIRGTNELEGLGEAI